MTPLDAAGNERPWLSFATTILLQAVGLQERERERDRENTSGREKTLDARP